MYCINKSASHIIPPLFGGAELQQPIMFASATVLGTRFFLSQMINLVGGNILGGLFTLSILFLLRILLRSQKAAFVAFILIALSFTVLANFWMIPASLIIIILYLLVLMRFGLVAAVLADCVAGLFQMFPIALETSAWYSDTGYAALAILAVVVLYSFRTSLGGRPLITAPHLDD